MRPAHGPRAFAPGDRGQATVEFALILPLLVIGALLLLQVGQVALLEIRLEHAAREGARAAAADPDTATRRALDAVARSAPQATTTVRVGARWVEVRVQREIPLVPLVNLVPRTASADVTMRREDVDNVVTP